MSNMNVEVAKKSWEGAPDSHVSEAIQNIHNYSPEIQSIIVQEAENRFGQSSAEKILSYSAEQEVQQKEFEGIGRLNYLFIPFGAAILCAIIINITKRNEFAILLSKIIMLLLSASLTYLRLKNIGWNGWWALLALVPGANLFIVIPCYILPGGYQQTKKFDTGSRVAIGIFLLFFIMLMIAILNN